jgi:DNA helicase IV
MLRTIATFTLATSVLLAVQAHADVYKYKDEEGNVLYTDKPATLPAERLNVQSQKTDVVAAQTRQDADMKRMQDADKSRQQATNQQREQQQAGQLDAKDKAEKCTQARGRYDKYMNSQKLYTQEANGERRYLSSEELDAARASAKATMDVLCK